MRIVFLGTPDYAVPSLEALVRSHHEVIAVVTQPDRPRGRNGNASYCPVKACAIEHGLTVLQYEKISREGVEDLMALQPDIMVTVAFGQILSTKVLNIAKHGVINAHASLLPKYRGSAPIQWAVLNGEKTTGITIMQTALSVDSGDIILQEKVDILPDETSEQLFIRLSEISSGTLLRALDLIESGKATFTPQNHSEATHFPMLDKAMGKIDWNHTAKYLHNFVRGMNSWPSAYFAIDDTTIKVHSVVVLDEVSTASAGTVVRASAKEGIVIASQDKLIRLDVIQPQNSKKMSSKDYMLGHNLAEGIVIG